MPRRSVLYLTGVGDKAWKRIQSHCGRLNSPDRAIQKRTLRQALDYQLRNPEYVAMRDQQLARRHRENSASLGLLDRDHLRMQLEGHLKDALIYKDAANSSIINSLSNQHIQVESSQGPRNDLASLISEKKYEKAFTTALQTSDRSTLSWLCSEVDLLGILSMSPLPLSQIVLLTLLQQVALDLNINTPQKINTSQKISWITHLAAAIDPMDPMIAFYVKPVFEELYRRCCYPSMIGPHFRSQHPSPCPALDNKKLEVSKTHKQRGPVMHVITILSI